MPPQPDQPLSILVIRPRLTKQVLYWTACLSSLAGGLYLLLCPLLYPASRAGDAINILVGLLVVTVSAPVLKARFPGASFLLLDQNGFTVRRHNRVQRLEWRSVSRMIVLGRSYQRTGGHPAGIRIIPKDTKTPAFLITDQYTIRRQELLVEMSRLAGPGVAIGFPEMSPQDRAFYARMNRFGFWAISSMFAVVMAGLVFVKLRQGKSPADLLFFVIAQFALFWFLCWVNSKDGRDG